jgi:hypothetical protein
LFKLVALPALINLLVNGSARENLTLKPYTFPLSLSPSLPLSPHTFMLKTHAKTGEIYKKV